MQCKFSLVIIHPDIRSDILYNIYITYNVGGSQEDMRNEQKIIP